MIQTIPRELIVEMLLNSLEAERYVRKPLLLNLVDELATSEQLAPATELARRLLSGLEAGSVAESDYQRRIDELRGCVQRLSRTGLAEASAEALARATVRLEDNAANAA